MALQGAAYYLGMLAYYWVLATPSVGLPVRLLPVPVVNWFHVHYDEAFTSCRSRTTRASRASMSRPEGDLHIYGLAMDKVGIHQLRENMGCSRAEMHCECLAFLRGQKGATGIGLGTCVLCAVSLLSGDSNCTCRRHAHGARGPVQDGHVQLNGSTGTQRILAGAGGVRVAGGPALAGPQRRWQSTPTRAPRGASLPLAPTAPAPICSHAR